MPVQTQILTRRGTAASWTSTNPTLGAGEIGYETDTGRFKIGTGAAAWASLGYFNRDPLTTKGDLYTFSTTDDRLAVGANGETIVADSSTSTGLRYQGNFAAGKNKIINGDFGIWQRGTSFTNPSNGYMADRWQTAMSASAPSTYSITRQTFTPGTAPVAGYEGQYFVRATMPSSGTIAEWDWFQPIEDVRTFAGQTVTLSFWAKSSSSTTLNLLAQQRFGSGGSGNVSALSGTASITTSWARYTLTGTLPSVAGKTIGDSSSLYVFLYSTTAINSQTIDVWGVQLEASSVATAFQTATGTIQGELAACQRYYYRNTATNVYGIMAISAFNPSATVARLNLQFPVVMRTEPTILDYSTILYQDFSDATFATSAPTIDTSITTKYAASVNVTIAGATSPRSGRAIANNNAAAYIGFSAEL